MASNADPDDPVIDRFLAEWDEAVRNGDDGPNIQEALSDSAPPWAQVGLVVELLRIDLRKRIQQAQIPTLEHYTEQLPVFADVIKKHFSTLLKSAQQVPRQKAPSTIVPSPFRAPSADWSINEAILAPSLPMPAAIGPYRIERQLGSGAFSDVYLGYHEQLKRRFAIKLLNGGNAVPDDAWGSLQHEAQHLVALRHPAIVRFFHLDRHAGQHYMVVEYVEGGSLAELLAQRRLSIEESVDIVRNVAEGLHAAHQVGVIHRDLKPANLLISREGDPRIADFGLALNYQHFGSGPRLAGTYQYMSPEQARSEAHRVDGRSDIFSLGAVFYELLTGQRPFHGDSLDQILQRIINVPPQPIRQVNAAAPKELERICLRCLAKRAADRYTCALDLVADLDSWKREQSASSLAAPIDATPRVVPKGLRSFDANDAEFFLSLLPGPRDRRGDPETIRFWKAWAEEPGEIESAIGVVYGPSGCGKSSLVRAGLLPRLAAHVDSVEVDAEAKTTGDRLLRRLQQRYPDVTAAAENLPTVLRELRELLPQQGRKLLIVVDQFEQHLHAHPLDQSSTLLQAMRQCDGVGLSALLVVRDDFWLSLKRFMDRVETPIRDGRNSLLVDLFDQPHARSVLSQLGRALGKLAADADETPSDRQFLDEAMQVLAPEGVASPVQIAVFVELMKRRRWDSQTLHNIEGVKGLGVAFLKEIFEAAATPQARAYSPVAQRILEALLPEGDDDIKGGAKSHDHLATVARQADRTVDFSELMDMLVHRFRLLSPTDLHSSTGAVKSDTDATTPWTGRSFQLTHDYLVPAVRDWLHRKKSPSELLLARRAGDWAIDQEARRLPGPLEYLKLSALTRHADWNSIQREMMRAARRYYALRAAALSVVVSAILWLGGAYLRDQREEAIVEKLLSAGPAEVATVVGELQPYRPSVENRLRSRLDSDLSATKAFKIHLSLAGQPASDEALHAVLLPRLSEAGARQSAMESLADPVYFDLARNALRRVGRLDAEELQTVAGNARRPIESRFRAAAALLTSTPHEQLNDPATLIDVSAEGMLQFDRTTRQGWLAALDPNFRDAIRDELLARLTVATDPADRKLVERVFETLRESFLSPDDPKTVLAIVDWADSDQIARVLPMRASALVATALQRRLDELLGDWARSDDRRGRSNLARRIANTAVAALTTTSSSPSQIWQLLDVADGEHPEIASRVLLTLGENALAVEQTIERLDSATEEDSPALVANLLLIGGLSAKSALSPSANQRLEALAAKQLREHPDSGVHSAAIWALQQMNSPIDGALSPPSGAKWRYAADGALFIELDAGAGTVGSPPGELGRDLDMWLLPSATVPTEIERRRRVRVGRFLIGAYEETVERYEALTPKYKPTTDMLSRSPKDPAHFVDWNDVGAYCNKLSLRENLPPAYDPETRNYDPVSLGYRLPTSDEWEVAARAGALSIRYYGDTPVLLDRFAWYAGNSQSARYNPVGSLLPNRFGLFDTLGNVTELCGDNPISLFEHQDNGPPQPYPGDHGYRIARGSAFNDAVNSLRCAQVWGVAEVIQNEKESGSIGFRLARTLQEQ